MDDHNHSVSFVTTSDPTTGIFSFAGLRPGTYQLVETQPNGYLPGRNAVGAVNGVTDGSQSPAGDPTVDTFVGIGLNAGDADVANDFGELLPNSLSGHVYSDLNDNGVFEPGAPNNEPGIVNVVVTLTGTDDLGKPVGLTTQTDVNGFYQFAGLRPSDSTGYTITETQPAGYLEGTDPSAPTAATARCRTFSAASCSSRARPASITTSRSWRRPACPASSTATTTTTASSRRTKRPSAA